MSQERHHERLIALSGEVRETPLLRLEHAVVRVGDLSQAEDWYGRLLQLGELAREGDRLYLTCGGELGFDLALQSGGTGLARFAYSVHDEETLDRLARTLRERGLAVTRASSPEPGVASALRFACPETSSELELIVREERRPYQVCTEWSELGVNGPCDLNHVTFAGGDIARFAEFLITALGFRLSDVWVPRSTGQLRFAFLRVGENHHDAAMLEGTSTGLHHIAFQMRDIGHVVSFADRTARLGVTGETGIVRHPPGNNMTFYVRDPWRNRIELLADIAHITDARAGVQCWNREDPVDLYNLWAPTVPPDSWINEVT